MMSFLAVLQYLTLAFWIGGMAGFMFIFSPMAFRQLPSKAMAGGVTGAVLPRLDVISLVSSGIMLVVTILQAIDGGGRAIDVGRVALVVAMLALTIFGATTVRSRLAAVRSRLPGEIDEADAGDPNRKEYRRWHGISMLAFLLVVLLGALLIALTALRYPMI